jgi:DNA-binding MarR family transcriptional regulator
MCKGQALRLPPGKGAAVDGVVTGLVAFVMSDSRNGSPSKPGCSLTLLLLDAARSVEASAEGALADIGLSLAKLGALRHLMLASSPLTLSQLAERHCCGKSNITQLIDRLEADGLVVRVADPDDRRTILATITDSGRAAYERANAILAEQERGLEGRLPAESRATLARHLTTLRQR